MMSSAAPNLGSYNQYERLQKIKKDLENKFAAFRKEHESPVTANTSKNGSKSGKEHGKSNGGPAGVQFTLLEEMKDNIQTTYDKIQKFDSGGHFTQEFRVLREECVKHQLSLDGFDYCGKEEFRKIRKDELCKIEEMLKALNGKMHGSGEPCEKCTLQKL